MTGRELVRRVVLGNTRAKSNVEYSRMMLTGQLALLAILICAYYLVRDLSQGIATTYWIYLSSIVVFSFSFYWLRLGRNDLSNYFLLPFADVLVYLVASSEPASTGISMFFFTVVLTGFVLFGHEQKLLSFLLLGFTFLLFVLANCIHFSLLPKRHYSEDMLLLNRLTNFSIALLGSILGVCLQIEYNHWIAQQREESNTQLAKANVELDRFVYSVSHDLKAPITSVLGLIDISTTGKQDVFKCLGIMEDQLHKLNKFIDDVAEYSRNNRMEVRKEKLNIKNVVEDVWDMLKYTPEANSIQMMIELPSDLELETDLGRLKVVLSNLMTNAIRYHDASKKNQFVRLYSETNGKWLYLMVEDNGQGIAFEHQQHVFDMFFRGSNTSKGSGLGLYIVKEALEKLSGSISVESVLDQGTTFKVGIPSVLN